MSAIQRMFLERNLSSGERYSELVDPTRRPLSLEVGTATMVDASESTLRIGVNLGGGDEERSSSGTIYPASSARSTSSTLSESWRCFVRGFIIGECERNRARGAKTGFQGGIVCNALMSARPGYAISGDVTITITTAQSLYSAENIYTFRRCKIIERYGSRHGQCCTLSLGLTLQ